MDASVKRLIRKLRGLAVEFIFCAVIVLLTNGVF